MMQTPQEYINLIREHEQELRRVYGITSMRMFGSMARAQQTSTSDIDLFVDTLTPNPFILMDAKDYIEHTTGRSVDIVRNHRNLNRRLKTRIERDGITVF